LAIIEAELGYASHAAIAAIIIDATRHH